MDFTSSFMSGPLCNSESAMDSSTMTDPTDNRYGSHNTSKKAKRRRFRRTKRIIVRVPYFTGRRATHNVSLDVSPKISEPRTVTLSSNNDEDEGKKMSSKVENVFQKVFRFIF